MATSETISKKNLVLEGWNSLSIKGNNSESLNVSFDDTVAPALGVTGVLTISSVGRTRVLEVKIDQQPIAQVAVGLLKSTVPLPEEHRPSQNITGFFYYVDNGTPAYGLLNIDTTGDYELVGGVLPFSGTAALNILNFSVSYSVQ